MNNGNIFKNAWSMMLHYRALWIFGVILALTTISFASVLWLSADDNNYDQSLVIWEISAKDQAWIKENFGLDLPLVYTLDVEDLKLNLDDPLISTAQFSRLLGITITIMAVLIGALIVKWVLRYTAEAALIFMVNDQQKNNIQHTARKGWTLGFSFPALKLFLIDLVVFILLLMISPLLFLPPLLPVFLTITGRPLGISIGILLMTSLTLLSLASLIVMWIIGITSLQLAHRACCLEGLGIFSSIWRALRLMRSQLGGIGLTWLVIVGLDFVYPLIMAPVAIVLAAVGLTVGGLLSAIVGSLLALILAKTTAWTVAIILGVVLLVLVVVLPLTMLGGLREVFKSSAWTLTFMEAVRTQKIISKSFSQPALQPAGAD